MVKDDVLFETISLFIFSFEEEEFDPGVTVVVEFEKSFNGKDEAGSS